VNIKNYEDLHCASLSSFYVLSLRFQKYSVQHFELNILNLRMFVTCCDRPRIILSSPACVALRQTRWTFRCHLNVVRDWSSKVEAYVRRRKKAVYMLYIYLLYIF